MQFTKIKSAEKRALHAQQFMTHLSSWRLGVLGSTIALLGSLTTAPALALGLGQVTVQSALGEALRAEVEVPEISAEEVASLRVGIASPAAFKAAGLEYSPTVTGVQVTLQKRANGRSFLSLRSDRPVTDPFVDLIIEASWASGRLVRDYTLLFDPPNLRQATQTSPTAPAVAAPRTPETAIASAPQAAPFTAPARTPSVIAPRPVSAAKAAAATSQEKPAASAKPTVAGQQVTVKAGDTASKIATQNKSASISLDQMLVALLKNNPDGFAGGNINRLRAGAVLTIPSAEDANSVSSTDASRTIVAQAKDFNQFRQQLATGAPMTQVQNASRQTAGKLQAKVEDRAPTAVAPDKLTLSKGAVKSPAIAEESIAKDKQSKDAAARVAELSKNIGDLSKMAGSAAIGAAGVAAPAASGAKAPGLPLDKPVTVTAAAPVPTASAAKPMAAPVVAAPVVAAPVVTASATAQTAATQTISVAATTTAVVLPSAITPTVSAAASTPSSTITPTTTNAPLAATTAASAPVAAKKPVVVAPPVPEPSLIDDLTSNEFVLPGLAALLALLAGFGFYRYKKRDPNVAVDSSFLESRLQPDSFFGASGGQRIDTNEANGATGSSMVYSPSQLDAAGDVDPVAEADVYLAYGRDLQAEEILKEALRTHPARVAIHSKLLEIYAKRRDLKAFEVVATEAFTLTRGVGPEWAYICELGRDVDSANALYQQGGQPSSAAPSAAITPAMAASFGGDTIPQMVVSSAATSAIATDVDFDLDLDFSDSNVGLSAAATVPSAGLTPQATRQVTQEPTVAMRLAPAPGFDVSQMDFSLDAPTNNNLNFELDLPTTATAPVSSPAKATIAPQLATTAVDSGMLEFDLASLSLDLGAPVTQNPTLAKTAVIPAQPLGALETKFALAEEFRTLGDSDGARSLASEVVAQAQGALRTKAQAFLNAL